MDISSLTRAASRMAEAADTAKAAEAGGIPKPQVPADPVAEAEFKEAMRGPEAVGDAADVSGVRPEGQVLPEDRVRPDAPVDAARRAEGRDAHSAVESVYADIVDTLTRGGHLSPHDLYRVQVLASMASVDVQRNTSAVQSMDQGLKTLLKDSG
ncbi:hypothetical protein [Desulfocurvus sp. DL9XJH121]